MQIAIITDPSNATQVAEAMAFLKWLGDSLAGQAAVAPVATQTPQPAQPAGVAVTPQATVVATPPATTAAPAAGWTAAPGGNAETALTMENVQRALTDAHAAISDAQGREAADKTLMGLLQQHGVGSVTDLPQTVWPTVVAQAAALTGGGA